MSIYILDQREPWSCDNPTNIPWAQRVPNIYFGPEGAMIMWQPNKHTLGTASTQYIFWTKGSHDHVTTQQTYPGHSKYPIYILNQRAPLSSGVRVFFNRLRQYCCLRDIGYIPVNIPVPSYRLLDTKYAILLLGIPNNRKYPLRVKWTQEVPNKHILVNTDRQTDRHVICNRYKSLCHH